MNTTARTLVLLLFALTSISSPGFSSDSGVQAPPLPLGMLECQR